MGGNAGVDFGNLEQFGLALGIVFFFRKLGGVFRHALCIAHDAFGRFDNRLVEVDFVDIFGIGVIQVRQVFLRFMLNVQHAFFHQDDVIAGVGVAAAVEGVVRAVGHVGFARKFPQTGFAVLGLAVFIHGLAFPVGEDFFAQNFFVFFSKIEGVLRAGADGVQLVAQPAPGNIGRKRASARCAVGCAHDEFIILNDQGRGFAAVAESLGAQQNARHAGVFAVNLGNGARTVNGDARHLQKIVGLELEMALGRAVRHVDAVRHASLGAGMLRGGSGREGDSRAGRRGKYLAQRFALFGRQAFGDFCYLLSKIMKIHVDSSMVCDGGSGGCRGLFRITCSIH